MVIPTEPLATPTDPREAQALFAARVYGDRRPWDVRGACVTAFDLGTFVIETASATEGRG